MDNVQLAMDVDKKTFEQEQSELTKFILNERFFKPWQNFDPDDYNNLSQESSLEIFITSNCNQNCKYCYLCNNKNLYPDEINNKDLILSNLQILCDWIISRDFYIPRVELYSGEIWHSSYGLEVLEILYQSLLRKRWLGQIIVPSNCSFVMDETQLLKIQRYINKFKKINVLLCFSISVDGMIVENFTRPLNNNVEKTEEFYERLFLFAKHNTFYFHPMISAESISLQKENLAWWKTMCDKYDMDFEEVMMLLEVRNPNWTDENIQEYCNVLDYLIEEFKERKCNSDNITFFKSLFGFRDEGMEGYVPYALPSSDTFAGCSISNYFTVRLGDMAICPCHRTAYNKFLYGWFKIEDGKITDIIGNNPQMAIRCLMTNNIYGTLQCDLCPFKEICLKGCFGSQYETHGDAFYPIENVCKMFRSKYTFLIKKYCDMGIMDFLNSYTPYYMHYPTVQKYKQIIQEVLKNATV